MMNIVQELRSATPWNALVYMDQSKLMPAGYLEERWQRLYGRNPLVCAYRVQNKERIYNTRLRPLTNLYGNVIWVFGLGTIFTLAYAFEKSHSELAVNIACVILGLILAALIVLHFSREHYKKKIRSAVLEGDVKEVYAFSSCLVSLLSNVDIKLTELNNMHMRQLEDLAIGLVTAAAARVLSFQTHPKPALGYVSEAQAAASADLRETYDTVRDLGLLKREGYEYYFEGAKQILREIFAQI